MYCFVDREGVPTLEGEGNPMKRVSDLSVLSGIVAEVAKA